MPRPLTDLVVLAGGESRRFGSPKALAPWRGKRLVDHVVDGLSPLAAKTIVVTNPLPEDPGWPGDKVVEDNPSLPAGPLRGIVAGLRECRAEWAWVVACDTPLISPELMSAVRETARRGDVAVAPLWEGRLQLLAACWEVAAAAALEKALKGGEQSPRRALESLGCVEFSAEKCREIDPEGRSFLNVNTPDDLAALDERGRD
jgi:molybdopterin-guanine dinucleotide biosynthesis protein A